MSRIGDFATDQPRLTIGNQTYRLDDLLDRTLTTTRAVTIFKGSPLKNVRQTATAGKQFKLYSWYNETYGTPQQNGIYLMFYETQYDYDTYKASYIKLDDFVGKVPVDVKSEEVKVQEEKQKEAADQSLPDKILHSAQNIGIALAIALVAAKAISSNR